ncbi:type VII secretion-associated serine protease mycosin [Mycobacteroides abscessus]|uniref:type VII secretion-associated serine protease mycosin n=1 Tax=Mycobacteroides abscessus TaxID=36809 RepID=UPI0019D017E2|nr:type VII secretion-associated serine protease mycosin [Mycobacteroides abscessus subsp. massiliense]
MVTALRRVAAVHAIIPLIWLCAPPAVAFAVDPPIVQAGPPPSGSVGPTEPTEQKSVCARTGVRNGTDLSLVPSAEMMLDYRTAWRYSRGAGQKVAVIDTGVTPNPRLHVEGGGDYVSGTDGLQDCDAHGTLVAGIIGAAESSSDAFSGVAPEAQILSIRQNSSSFAIKGSGADKNNPSSNSPGYGNTTTLAYAITRAVDMGSSVINLSEVACAPVGLQIDDAALGRAVRYAFERNVVVVAAAGNVSKNGICQNQNETKDPNLPIEAAWSQVRTVASPAWFSDYVLTVGALNKLGQPAEFSLSGPWVGVAAPGEGITSLASDGPGVINGVYGQDGLAPINGTSFATPFVSGVVALVRSRFPELNAAQVIDRIKRTARTPDNGPNIASGYGMVDPVAALTASVPPSDQMPNPTKTTAVSLPKRSVEATRARNIILAGTALVIAAMGAIWALYLPRRRREEATSPITDTAATDIKQG